MCKSIATEWRRLIDNLQTPVSRRTAQNQLNTVCNMLFIPAEVQAAAKDQLDNTLPAFYQDQDIQTLCSTILHPHTAPPRAAMFIACVSDQLTRRLANGQQDKCTLALLQRIY